MWNIGPDDMTAATQMGTGIFSAKAESEAEHMGWVSNTGWPKWMSHLCFKSKM